MLPRGSTTTLAELRNRVEESKKQLKKSKRSLRDSTISTKAAKYPSETLLNSSVELKTEENKSKKQKKKHTK